MTLELIKMGMDYDQETTAKHNDGINNYRVRTTGECIPGKDGKMYFVEFTTSDRYITRTINKRNGQPLKKPVRELVLSHALWIDTQYTNERGSYRNIKFEREMYNKFYVYNIENILATVNELSTNKYTTIKFIDR